MKIKFTCYNCEDCFNIDTKYLKDKTSIVCPNCSREFPQDSFEKLKTSLVNLDEVANSLIKTTDYGFETSEWKFDII